MKRRPGQDRQSSASAADANRFHDVDLLRSLFLVATVVTIALVGLALDGNWPKVLRVTLSAACYVAVLLALRSRARRHDPSPKLGYGAFVIAGLAAGAVSGLVREDVQAGVFVAGALGTGVFISAVHWTAVSRWRQLRTQISMPGGLGV